MYNKTSRIIIPTTAWTVATVKINRTRLKTILDRAMKANQLDNWNCGKLEEGDSIFEPRDKYEKELWEAIREENRKLFQRSNAGRNANGGWPRNKKIDL